MVEESFDEDETKVHGNVNGDGFFLIEEHEHQLKLDEQTLRETLEEAKVEKEWEERIRQEREYEEMLLLEFGMMESDYESD